MTLDSDFIRVHLEIGTYDISCSKAELTWPPPDKIYFCEKEGIREARPGDNESFTLFCESKSSLPDEVAAHPNIARGAVYRYKETT